MTLLFDLLGSQPNGFGTKYHGGGEYIKTIFKRLVEKKVSEEIIAFYNFGLYLDDWIVQLISEKNIESINISNYNELSDVFENHSIDVYYSGMPYGCNTSIIPENVKKIGTFHGLRELELPTDRFEYKYHDGRRKIKSWLKLFFIEQIRTKMKKMYAQGLCGFDILLTDSEHSKYALRMFFPELDNKPIFVYYAPSKYVKNKRNIRFDDFGRFFLIIGLNRWEKNGYRAVKALDALYSQNRLNDYKAILVGKVSNTIKNEIVNLDHFVFMDYVEPDILESLYQQCEVFLYPSLNEGFGMPPLEAMAYNKTCIVAADTSLMEVCGDAVYYFNPYDVNELSGRILMAVDKKIPKEKIEEHLLHIKDKQTKDLERICDCILGKESI